MLLPTPALASRPSNAARTYLEARAAAIEGNHSRSAALFAELVDTRAGSPAITKEAVSQAISAGDMKLALRLVKGLRAEDTPVEARLLQVGDALRANDSGRALALLRERSEAGDLGFVTPFVQAWAAADARNPAQALAALDGVASGNLLAGLAPEHRALILLKFGRSVDAQPYVDQALKIAGGLKLAGLGQGLVDELISCTVFDQGSKTLGESVTWLNFQGLNGESIGLGGIGFDQGAGLFQQRF